MGSYRCYFILEPGRDPRIVEIQEDKIAEAFAAVRAVVGAPLWRDWSKPATWSTEDGRITVTRHELVILPDLAADPLTLGTPDDDTPVPVAGTTWAGLDAYRERRAAREREAVA